MDSKEPTGLVLRELREIRAILGEMLAVLKEALILENEEKGQK